MAILINSSTTAVSYWGYFSDVIVSKTSTDGIRPTRNTEPAGPTRIYNMAGQSVGDTNRPGLYIVHQGGHARTIVVK